MSHDFKVKNIKQVCQAEKIADNSEVVSLAYSLHANHL